MRRGDVRGRLDHRIQRDGRRDAMASTLTARTNHATTHGTDTAFELADETAALARNPGMTLDLGLVEAQLVNRSAVERRAATLPTRRTVKKEWQAAWLLRAIACMDLTTLAGDDTPGTVRRLCAKARQPLRADLAEGLGIADLGLRVGAVCVYHNLVPVAVEALAGSGIPVAAVSTGFPAAQNPLPLKIEEIKASVAAGASEIDIVISRAAVLIGDWRRLYDEVRAYREACGA